MFTTGISKNTQDALAKISKAPFVKNYYLAEGSDEIEHVSFSESQEKSMSLKKIIII